MAQVLNYPDEWIKENIWGIREATSDTAIGGYTCSCPISEQSPRSDKFVTNGSRLCYHWYTSSIGCNLGSASPWHTGLITVPTFCRRRAGSSTQINCFLRYVKRVSGENPSSLQLKFDSSHRRTMSSSILKQLGLCLKVPVSFATEEPGRHTQ